MVWHSLVGSPMHVLQKGQKGVYPYCLIMFNWFNCIYRIQYLQYLPCLLNTLTLLNESKVNCKGVSTRGWDSCWNPWHVCRAARQKQIRIRLPMQLMADLSGLLQGVNYFDIFWYVSESQISFLCAIMRYSDTVDSVVTLWILISRYPNQALDKVHSVFSSFPTFPFFLPISLCWPKHLSLIIGQIGSAKLDAFECIQWVWHTFLRSTFFQRLRWKLRRRVNMSSSLHRLFCFPYFDYVIHVINFTHPLFALVYL